ncbi:hypothetical protein FC35_GL001691 [Limosilactobacillus coleohominis DSM 14060]|nr:hypothetical protein FC35_GL001691 [Limosilactobacillus coleohominis DSM 14060]
MNGKWNEIKHNFLAVITVVFGIITSIGISFYTTLVCSGVFLKIPRNFVGIDSQEVMVDYYRLVIYLMSFTKKKFEFDQIPMSTSAIQHFADVHYLTQAGELITMVCGLLFIVFFYYEKKRYQLWRLVPLFEQALILICVLMFLFLASFQDSFLHFHEIVFQNNDWVFDPKTDPIILILTENYFIHYLLVWLALTLFLILVIIWITKLLINFFFSWS